MGKIEWATIVYVVRKFGLPVLFGALVVWLVKHGYDNWANVVCSIGDAIAIEVKECR